MASIALFRSEIPPTTVSGRASHYRKGQESVTALDVIDPWQSPRPAWSRDSGPERQRKVFLAPHHWRNGPPQPGRGGRCRPVAECAARGRPGERSGLVWDIRNLDAWLKNPAALVPGNAMGFPGIADARTRADLVAYLEAVSAGRVSAPDRGLRNLKDLDAESRVTAIRYCGDTYRLTTSDRKTHTFWEFNLRFKTDGSADGPPAGKPVLIGAGMQGDRAVVVFTRPEEISTFSRRQCP